MLVGTLNEALDYPAQVLIINLKSLDLETWKEKIRNEITTLMFFKDIISLSDKALSMGYVKSFQNSTLSIFKRDNQKGAP